MDKSGAYTPEMRVIINDCTKRVNKIKDDYKGTRTVGETV